MAYEYEKNDWEGYLESKPLTQQPNAIITKIKLDRMENGIERANMTFEAGNITISNDENPSVSFTTDEINHTRKLNIAFPKQKASTGGASINDSEESDKSTYSSNKIASLVNDLNEKIEDLSYKKINIDSFSCSPSTAENGQTINTINLSWKTNTTPISLMLNGSALPATQTSAKITDIITNNTTYTLIATDKKNNSHTKSAGISFLNGVYYGTYTKETDFTNLAAVMKTRFTKNLRSNKNISFTVKADSNQYIYFACPSSFGTPTFYVGGFEGGFDKIGSFAFKNSYEYTTQYDIYVSTNDNLGSTTVQCS